MFITWNAIKDMIKAKGKDNVLFTMNVTKKMLLQDEEMKLDFKIVETEFRMIDENYKVMLVPVVEKYAESYKRDFYVEDLASLIEKGKIVMSVND